MTIFSIIISTFNSEKFLEQTIKSILNQKFSNYEILIIDGKSIDNSVNIIEKYKDRISFFISEPDTGIYDAWNKALPHVKGEWILFLGSDDYFYDDMVLENVNAELINAKLNYFAYGTVYLIEEPYKIVNIIYAKEWEKIKNTFFQVNCIHHQGVFHNRALFEKFGFFNPIFKIAGDYEVLLRTLKENIPFKLNSNVAYARVGGISSNLSHSKKAFIEIKKARILNGFNVFPIIWYWQFFKLHIKLLLLKLFGKNVTKKLTILYKRMLLIKNKQKVHFWKPYNPLLKIAGFFIDIISFPVGLFSKKSPILSSPKKILVIDCFLIGDNIMTTALLCSLKTHYPDAKIHTFGNKWMQDVFSSNLVDKMHIAKIPWSTYDYSFTNFCKFFKTIIVLKKEKYDIALETRGDWRNCFILWLINGKNRVSTTITGGKNFINCPTPKISKNLNLNNVRLVLAKYLTGDAKNYKMCLPITNNSIDFVENFFKVNKLEQGKFFVFHPGASKEFKTLPKNMQLEIVSILAKRYPCIIVLGPNDKFSLTKDDLHDINFLNPVFFFQESLNKLMQLMKLSCCNLTMDSAAAHISAANDNYTIVFIAQKNAWESVKPLSDKAYCIEYNELSWQTENRIQLELFLSETIT